MLELVPSTIETQLIHSPRVLDQHRDSVAVHEQVELLSQHQRQLFQLSVQAAQFQKAYVDDRVRAVATDARTSTDALGEAVTQVYTDQVMMKQKLTAHLNQMDDDTRHQLDELHRDLLSRQRAALEAVDHRVGALAQATKAVEHQLVVLQSDASQGNLVRRIDGLESSCRLAVDAIRAQVTALEDYCSGRLREDVRESITGTIDEAEARIMASVRVAVTATSESVPMRQLEKSVASQGKEIASLRASIASAVSVASAPQRTTVRALETKVSAQDEIISTLRTSAGVYRGTVAGLETKLAAQDDELAALLARTAALESRCDSVRMLEEKVTAQSREIEAMRATAAATTTAPPRSSLRALEMKVATQDEIIATLRGAVSSLPSRDSMRTLAAKVNTQEEVIASIRATAMAAVVSESSVQTMVDAMTKEMFQALEQTFADTVEARVEAIAERKNDYLSICLKKLMDLEDGTELCGNNQLIHNEGSDEQSNTSGSADEKCMDVQSSSRSPFIKGMGSSEDSESGSDDPLSIRLLPKKAPTVPVTADGRGRRGGELAEERPHREASRSALAPARGSRAAVPPEASSLSSRSTVLATARAREVVAKGIVERDAIRSRAASEASIVIAEQIAKRDTKRQRAVRKVAAHGVATMASQSATRGVADRAAARSVELSSGLARRVLAQQIVERDAMRSRAAAHGRQLIEQQMLARGVLRGQATTGSSSSRSRPATRAAKGLQNLASARDVAQTRVSQTVDARVRELTKK